MIKERMLIMKRRKLAKLLAVLVTVSAITGCSGADKKMESIPKDEDRVSADDNEKEPENDVIKDEEEQAKDVDSAVENENNSSDGTDTSQGSTVSLLEKMQAVNVGTQQIMDDKYRSFYEVFLYSFYDSDGNGIGDIKGLIDKLDYINDGDSTTTTDLGLNGIWLMPIMPSTTYHKYDVTDYEAIDEEYGTMEDFEELVEECHKRGIELIIDFVINHTSSQHPWFKEAVSYIESLNGAKPSAEECPAFGYYNFTQEKKSNAYYQVGDTDWYYEGQFWSEMPDLNLENPILRDEISYIVEFWLEKGIDGFRLDATSQYTTGNTTANVADLTWFNDMVKAKKSDAYIVGECWENSDVYTKYYQSGVDSFFDFDFANSTGIIASTLNDASGNGAQVYANSLERMQDKIAENSDKAIDAPFYSNHDMDRSAGYYAGDYSENKTKMAGAMNLMMGGCAFVYYGDELGMKGSGADENKRAPMYWKDDRNASGMCKGPAGMSEIKMKYASFEEQEKDGNSIYNFYKQAILLRNCNPEIARGKVRSVREASDSDVCVITKEYNGNTIALAFNLSEEEKTVDMSSLSEYGMNGELNISGLLLTKEGDAQLNNKELTLPAYSMAIVK